jgi:hypothetical protein
MEYVVANGRAIQRDAAHTVALLQALQSDVFVAIRCGHELLRRPVLRRRFRTASVTLWMHFEHCETRRSAGLTPADDHAR